MLEAVYTFLIFYRPLLAGHCGRIVYMEGEEKDEIVLYPVAMFVGEAKARPGTGERVYQAVMLHHNISDIEESYSKEVNGLRMPTKEDHEDQQAAKRFYQATSSGQN